MRFSKNSFISSTRFHNFSTLNSCVLKFPEKLDDLPHDEQQEKKIFKLKFLIFFRKY